MMPSNILSRILPPTDSPSIYETLREYDRASDSDDIEERAGLGTPPPQRPLLPSASAAISPSAQPLRKPSHSQTARRLGRRGRVNPHTPEPDEADDDVPASLLIETDDDGNPLPHPLPPRPGASNDPSSPNQLPTLPEEGGLQAKWNTTQQQQQLHDSPTQHQRRPNLASFNLNPREKALWRWTNVENLDNFLKDVYDYYVGKGIYSITLNRILNLL
jgi:autophagy-related protein 9